MPTQPKPVRRRAATPRKGEVREQAILSAAEHLLGERGYDAMTISDIAAAAGITRGALYFYFGSKEDVLTALFAQTVHALREKSRDLAADAARGEAAIDAAMIRTEELWQQHGVVMRTAIDMSSAIPEIDALWSETADIFIAAIAEILRHSDATPASTSPTDVTAIAQALCWMIERSFYQSSRISGEELARARVACTEVWQRVARGQRR